MRYTLRVPPLRRRWRGCPGDAAGCQRAISLNFSRLPCPATRNASEPRGHSGGRRSTAPGRAAPGSCNLSAILQSGTGGGTRGMISGLPAHTPERSDQQVAMSAPPANFAHIHDPAANCHIFVRWSSEQKVVAPRWRLNSGEDLPVPILMERRNRAGRFHSVTCGRGTGVRASNGRFCPAQPSVPSGYQATCV
jgi:hypothetical protein